MDEEDRGCFGAKRSCCACRVEWAMWGNINTLYAAAILFIGAMVGATVETIRLDDRFGPGIAPHTFGYVTRWIVIPLSLAIFFIEYPLSARRNNKRSVERLGQKYIAPFLHITGFVGRNYFLRSVVYLVAILPCIFVLSTILGAICLFFGALCYFFAALNREQWKAPSLAWGPGSRSKEEEPVGHKLPEAPSHPPPRPPPQVKSGISDPPTQPPPRPIQKE